jgi:hypothetical protein
MAVRCRSDRVSAAVSPAKSATFPIGSIVVQRVAKSLLILINRADIGKRGALISNKPQINGETKLSAAVRGWSS